MKFQTQAPPTTGRHDVRASSRFARRLWDRAIHLLRCGGGYWTYDPHSGESRCGFCGFLYEIYP